MKTPELSPMEFAAEKARSDRKIWANKGWNIEYTIDFTSPSGRPAPLDSQSKKKVRTVYALHGFARPLEDFASFTQAWPERCAFISVHLPHHGTSGPDLGTRPLDDAIEPKDLLLLLNEIALHEGVSTSKPDLIGYSIGGRIALSLIAIDPKKWNRVLLLAPDGLKQSPFYGLTVHTQLGKALWFAIDTHSQAVLLWSNRFLNWKLLTPHMHAFIAFHLSSHSMRMAVWNGWRAHRKCWPSHHSLATAFSQTEGSIDLFFGIHDRIIPLKNGNRLRQKTNSMPHVNFHSIPSGHGMLREDVLKIIIQRTFKT